MECSVGDAPIKLDMARTVRQCRNLLPANRDAWVANVRTSSEVVARDGLVNAVFALS